MISQNADMPAVPFRPGVVDRKPKHDPSVFQVLEMTLEPGTSMSANHTHNRSEIYYVAQGKMRVQVGEEEAIVDAGCYFYIPAGTPHEFKEVLEKTVLVNVATPELTPADDHGHSHPSPPAEHDHANDSSKGG
jgi:quercetin dioxygenase-like cupin family protein